MVKKARVNIEKMGLERSVTVVEGDALKVIPKLEGKFDFVFLDAVKKDYFNYFKALRPMLKPGAVIIADNVIRSGNQMKDFLDAMEKDPDYDMVILRCSMEKGDGVALIYKLR
jgi:predicted O-methyltransferase YrrM